MINTKKYIIDVHTSNLSFIQTAKHLNVLGIKNNVFFLRLYNKNLQHVNPHDPNLSKELMAQVLNECIINPWYFLREVAMIPEQGGGGMRYKLHRGNLAATWCILKGIQNYLVIPRQTGKTQSVLAIIDWAYLLGTTNSEFMFVNKTQEDSCVNLERLKRQKDLLPKYLQFNWGFDESGRKIQNTDNVKSINNVNNNNSIVTKPKATSKEKAESLGRGLSQPFQHFDEAEFTSFVYNILQTSGPAYKSAAANAKKNNAFHCRAMTTTPGDLDTAACQQALRIVNEACKWSESLYDKTDQEIQEYISMNSRNGFVYIEYQYTQLGYDEVWFKESCQSVMYDPIAIKREILLKRIHGSSNSPFDQSDIDVLDDYVGSIILELYIHRMFVLNVYCNLIREKIYFVGVDCATGVGKDNTAVTVVDPYKDTVVAEFRSPFIGTEDTSEFIYKLVRNHIPRAVLCVERNHVGAAIIERLKAKGLNNNLYYDNTKDPHASGVDDKMTPDGYLKYEAMTRKLYGVYTLQGARDLMMEILYERVKNKKEKFIGDYVIGDIRTLIRNKQGKIIAMEGMYDDSVMSYLMCMYVLIYGNNLDRYGYIKGSRDIEDMPDGLLNEYTDTKLTPELIETLPEEMQNMYNTLLKSETDDRYLEYKEIYDAIKADSNTPIGNTESSYQMVDRDADFENDYTLPDNFFDDLNN